MTSKSKERLRQEMDHAQQSYAQHQIVSEEPGRWLVRKPGTGVFWFEVVCLSGGMLLVHGDTAPVIFGHYRDDTNAVERLRWMASRGSPDDHYFVEKAGIGMGSDALLWDPDDDVLREEIRELIEESKSDENEERRSRIVEALEEALDRVGDVPHDTVKTDIYEALEDAESIPRGRVISSRMIYAHAALQRLLAILDERAKVPWC